MARLPRKCFQHDAVTLAKALLGQELVRVTAGRRVAGLIVETEAYLGVADKAAHTYNGQRTAHNESMWGQGGLAYVYFTYGMHFCMNVVASRPGDPQAVLIRALEPTEGQGLMRRRRTSARRDEQLCSGPAKLCQALDIDRGLDAVDLSTSGVLYIRRRRQRCLPGRLIEATARIGVGSAGSWADQPLRFCIKASPHLSVPPRDNRLAKPAQRR
jgi:DNA-3-methyladenine glycosylase